MPSDPTPESQANSDGLWRVLWRGISRVPGKALIVLGLFLLVAALMAVHTAMTREDCTLRVKVQHGFLSAQLFV